MLEYCKRRILQVGIGIMAVLWNRSAKNNIILFEEADNNIHKRIMQ